MDPPPCSLLSSPFLSPNVSALLKIKILSWSQETGFPVCVRVRIADTTFNLHKLPLTSKSGYFRERLRDSNEVELPPDFPGGAETFQTIALFIYGSSTLVDPFNVAPLRCGAEFLRMTEEYGGTGNLCERFDVYLNHVVLQSWDDTLVVLHNSQTLLPWAEDVLMVSRCIETLAFMACMEILDPERRRDHDVVTLQSLSRRRWGDEMVMDILARDLWVKDLTNLPFVFFKRVVASLRRQGMKEKYVGPIVLVYAHRWLIGNSNDFDSTQGVVDLLPLEVKAIPVAFYLSLLSASVQVRLTSDSLERLRNQIASVLHLAHLQDFLCVELCLVESIFSRYLTQNMGEEDSRSNYTYVAQLWDTYLNEIAYDSEMSCKRFISLIEIVPISSRQSHDHLYRALNTFFKSHPNLTQEEKGMVCKYLNCSKLSQQVCIEAVQNEVMPLRLIVQALFVQQLNTQQAFKECSDSFRCGGEYFSELTLSSSRYANSSPCIVTDSDPGNSRALGLLLQKDSLTRMDYESTSFRIESLEKELMTLKRKVQVESRTSEGERRVINKKIKPVRSCVGAFDFASHRKCVNKIIKMLRRVALFGRSKRKPAVGRSDPLT